MVTNHYRWDFIGLSTDTKPTPATSEKVVDGSTYYCSDNSKLYVFYKDTWYEKTVSGGGTSYTAGTGIDITGNKISVDTNTIQPKLTAGEGIDITDNTISATGGSSVTVVQTKGSSTTDVMSQNATTSMVFADPTTTSKVQIGNGATAHTGDNVISIGSDSSSTANGAMALGWNARCSHIGSVALGCQSSTTGKGQVNIRAGYTQYGYNNTYFRILTGVHDGQGNHDAATVAQGNKLMTVAPTTSDEGVLGQLWTDTTAMHTYQCTAISGSEYTWTQRW